MSRLFLFLKGMAMGAADLVPGVSGGTIALIAGIYEELLEAIQSVNAKALKLLLSGRWRDFWEHINGSFLATLFAGIFTSVFLFSRLLTYLLADHPIPVWSFFFGLIIVSAYFVFPHERRIKNYAFFGLGVAAAYTISMLSAAQTPEAYWFVFLSGAIAICAMILPGISGSFILLLLGKYAFILNALKTLDIGVIIVFGVGCVVGLLSFTRLIYWLLSHYKSITLATLAGFMIGSLGKIWPWKITIGDSYENVAPQQYELLTGAPNLWGFALLFFLVGALFVWLMERAGRKVS
ncbi:MAG: DUF368 domain-containing protein [Pseudomonadota bacterium]|nr:DUF368 domain-containing protein [Pseudomonadota bacterium]